MPVKEVKVGESSGSSSISVSLSVRLTRSLYMSLVLCFSNSLSLSLSFRNNPSSTSSNWNIVLSKNNTRAGITRQRNPGSVRDWERIMMEPAARWIYSRAGEWFPARPGIYCCPTPWCRVPSSQIWDFISPRLTTGDGEDDLDTVRCMPRPSTMSQFSFLFPFLPGTRQTSCTFWRYLQLVSTRSSTIWK